MFLSISDLKEIASLMKGRLKIDYVNFNVSFFRRRVAYMFDKLSIHRIQELESMLGSLMKDDEITYYMAVPGTEMFRAPAFWHSLKSLLESDSSIKSVWMPCVSSYHELYSLAIILNMSGRTDIKVVANVVSDKIVADIKLMSLSKHNDEVDCPNFERIQSGHLYSEFVTEEDDGMKLRDDLIDQFVFRNGWFMNTDDEKYDMIVFRNSLLAYNRVLHEHAIQKLTDSLSKPGAVLCLGVKERPLGCENRLNDDMANDGIFKLV